MTGEGNHVTKPFTVELPWRIKYSFKGTSNVFVYVCSSDGQEGELVVNEVAPKSGASYPEKPVDGGYLKIKSDGPWHLVIEKK
jgi:hypothetical protein